MDDSTHIGQYKGDKKYGGGWVTQGSLKTHFWLRELFPDWEFRVISKEDWEKENLSKL